MYFRFTVIDRILAFPRGAGRTAHVRRDDQVDSDLFKENPRWYCSGRMILVVVDANRQRQNSTDYAKRQDRDTKLILCFRRLFRFDRSPHPLLKSRLMILVGW